MRILSDMRFRAVCVLLALVGILGWLLVKASPNVVRQTTEFKLVDSQLLGQEGKFRLPADDGGTIYRGFAAVLSFENVPKNIRFLLDENGSQTALQTANTARTGRLCYVLIPRGNRLPLKGAKCLAESFDNDDFMYPGQGKVVGLWTVPELPASPILGLKPAPSRSVAASIVYLARKNRDPLAFLRVTRPAPDVFVHPTNRCETTYCDSIGISGSFVYGPSSYFALPFAEDQTAARVHVDEDPPHFYPQDFTLPGVKVVTAKDWPEVQLTRDAVLTCPNGIRIQIPAQTLCHGHIPKLRLQTIPIRYKVTNDLNSVTSPSVMFSLLGLEVNGVHVESLKRDTPAGAATNCRLHAQIWLASGHDVTFDVPISAPPHHEMVQVRAMQAAIQRPAGEPTPFLHSPSRSPVFMAPSGVLADAGSRLPARE